MDIDVHIDRYIKPSVATSFSHPDLQWFSPSRNISLNKGVLCDLPWPIKY